MIVNSKEYWEKRFEENWEEMQGIEQTLFFANIACELLPDYIVREIKNKKYTICDMGCALGQGTNFLSKFLGINIDGADFSQDAINKAIIEYPQNHFRVLDLTKIPDDVKYDVVYSSNVLEHFSDPWKIFDNLSEVTEHYIILLVPFEETMKVTEHMYKFTGNNIPVFRSGFTLIYSNSIDGKEKQNTLYADNQILLVYKRQSKEYPMIYLQDLSAKESLLTQKLQNIVNEKKELYKENEKLEEKIIKFEQEKEQTRNCIDGIEKDNKKLKEEYEKLENSYKKLESECEKNEEYNNQQVEDLTKKLQNLENELEVSREMLRMIKESYSWKCTKILRSISKKLGIYKLHNTIKNKQDNGDKIVPLSTFEEKLESYLQTISQKDNILLVFSGVKFVENEGQRNIRLVQEAIKEKVKVIYVYWRWSADENIDETYNSNYMFQIPIDIFIKIKENFFERKFLLNEKKMLLIEFPHKYAIDVIDMANCFGWKTIYDIIDEWEEFSRKGQAVWYDSKVEYRIVNQVDAIVVTADRLKKKFEKHITRNIPIYVISNGVNPNQMRPSEKNENYNYSEGNLQIGYFGHLTDAWFDWKILKDMAVDHPEWTFHIIGYGAPEYLEVPKNIKLYGKQEPEELPKFAAYWDVAIIPFINCELTMCVNPIKAYEYLQLGLPIVASNMPEVKKMPYAQTAIGKDEFEMAICRAAKMNVDEEEVKKFINKNTWTEKWRAMFYVSEQIKNDLKY